MITPELSAQVSANGLSGVLRVDEIRRDTLIAIAEAFNEDGGKYDFVDAMERLAAVVAGDPTDGELDAALDRVEDACGGMEAPEIRISSRQVRGLRADLGKVEAALTLPRIDGESTVAQQRGQAGAA